MWKIESGFDPLEARVQIDLRVNSPKLKEGSRNFFQVRGLCNEAANRPELFTAEDQVLLRWLSDFLPLLLTDKNRVASPFLNDNRSLLTWLTQWGTSGRCHWEEGAPVEFSPLSARIVPQLHPAPRREQRPRQRHRGSILISRSSPPPACASRWKTRSFSSRRSRTIRGPSWSSFA